MKVRLQQCFSFPLSQLPPPRRRRRKGSRTSADRALSGGSKAVLPKGGLFARPATPPLFSASVAKLQDQKKPIQGLVRGAPDLQAPASADRAVRSGPAINRN